MRRYTRLSHACCVLCCCCVLRAAENLGDGRNLLHPLPTFSNSPPTPWSGKHDIVVESHKPGPCLLQSMMTVQGKPSGSRCSGAYRTACLSLQSRQASGTLILESRRLEQRAFW